MQRQITTSDSNLQKLENSWGECQNELSRTKAESQSYQSSLREAQKRIDAHEAVILRLKGKHGVHISFLEERIKDQTDKCAELEKTAKTLQNEKAELTGAVEAREAKLAKITKVI